MRKVKKEAGDSLVKKLPSGSALWNVWAWEVVDKNELLLTILPKTFTGPSIIIVQITQI